MASPQNAESSSTGNRRRQAHHQAFWSPSTNQRRGLLWNDDDRKRFTDFADRRRLVRLDVADLKQKFAQRI